jgi:chromosome segregation ATPase
MGREDTQSFPLHMLGGLEKGQAFLERTMQTVLENVEEHGKQLARGEENFKTLNSAIKELSDDVKSSNDKVEKMAGSILQLTQEFKECRLIKNTTGNCDISSIQAQQEKKESPGIIINIPKIDFSDLKTWMVIIAIIATLFGIKFSPAILHSLGG